MHRSYYTPCLLFLSFVSVVHLLPQGRPFDEEIHDLGLGASAFTMEGLEVFQIHDPLENAGVILEEGILIEGDIRRRPSQLPRTEPPIPAEAMAGYSKGESFNNGLQRSQGAAHQLRNAKPFRDEIWTDRIVPFQLDNDFNTTERAQIHQAMTEVMEGSGHCLTFVNRTDEADFVYITGKIRGCYSDVGRQGGNQTISVDRSQGCVRKGIIMHELMHALGFWHEHTRYDRDRYIRIITNNIEFNHLKDFNVQEGNLQNISYDYYSILHYSTSMFSKDSSLKTIEILDPTMPEEEVGQRKYLSDKDKLRLKALYECPKTKCAYPHTRNDETVQVVNTTVGSRIVYSCSRSDLVLVGAQERTCLFDGTWSGSPPLCFTPSAAMSLCDFETLGICGWTQDISDEADWTRHASHTESSETGPLVDHTRQDSEGYYMYLEGSHILPNSSARLLSPVLQAENNANRSICVLFWYNMYGAGMGTMRVKIQTGDVTHQLWSLSGNQSFGWKFDLIHVGSLQPTAPYRIIFEAIRGPRDTTDMAIDDVMVGPCETFAGFQDAVIRESKQEEHTLLHNCDFDHHVCGWYNDTSSGMVWNRHSGTTPSLYTGPMCDLLNCTYGSYVYFEASNSPNPGNTARTFSPILKGNGFVCISFGYHMYGSDIGNLTLDIQQGSGTRAVWSATGDHGNVWLDGHIQVNVNGTFQLAMIAVRGDGFRGDIAFDNIIVTTGRCPTVIHCDFDDKHFCGLYNDKNSDNFDWAIAHGNDTTSPNTGPRADHLTGSGRFVYIEASAPRVPGDIARLLTPFLPVNDIGYCVSFWYYMYGHDVATLRLLVRKHNGTKDTVWKEAGNIGPKWVKAVIYIQRTDHIIQIVFEGEVGASYRSDIALDDVIVTEGKCG